MRQRNYGIQVRVTKEEKKQMERMAKREGVSLSAYLRKQGMKKVRGSRHPDEMYEIYRQLAYIREQKRECLVVDVEQDIEKLMCQVLTVYHVLLEDQESGSDKDMGN